MCVFRFYKFLYVCICIRSNIFQPFNENEDAPMYYRQHMEIEQNNQVSLNNYVKQKFKTQYKKNDLEQKEDLSNNIEIIHH